MCNISHLYLVAVITAILLTAIATSFTLHNNPSPSSNDNLHSFFFTSFITLSIVSYLRAHFTSPGSASDWYLYRPDLLYPGATPTFKLLASSNSYLDIIEDANSEIPSCTYCEKPKPPRVHHCSACATCILRFDHHCPWLAACIGLLNAKFFLLFLLYTTLSAGYSTVLLLRFLLACRYHAPNDPIIIILLAFVVPSALAVSAASFLVVGAILVWNIWLMMINQTALENFRANNPHSRPSQLYDYSSSTLANCRHLLGWNLALWLIPIHQRRGPPLKTKS